MTYNGAYIWLEKCIKQEVYRRIEYDQTMRHMIHIHQPLWPRRRVRRCGGRLVECGHEAPHVAEEEQPDDGERDAGDAALAAAPERRRAGRDGGGEGAGATGRQSRRGGHAVARGRGVVAVAADVPADGGDGTEADDGSRTLRGDGGNGGGVVVQGAAKGGSKLS